MFLSKPKPANLLSRKQILKSLLDYIIYEICISLKIIYTYIPHNYCSTYNKSWQDKPIGRISLSFSLLAAMNCTPTPRTRRIYIEVWSSSLVTWEQSSFRYWNIPICQQIRRCLANNIPFRVRLNSRDWNILNSC